MLERSLVGQKVPWSPEMDMIAVMLVESLLGAERFSELVHSGYRPKDRFQARRFRQEAEDWAWTMSDFEDPEYVRRGFYTFRQCCVLFRLDPNAVRTAVVTGSVKWVMPKIRTDSINFTQDMDPEMGGRYAAA